MLTSKKSFTNFCKKGFLKQCIFCSIKSIMFLEKEINEFWCNPLFIEPNFLTSSFCVYRIPKKWRLTSLTSSWTKSTSKCNFPIFTKNRQSVQIINLLIFPPDCYTMRQNTSFCFWKKKNAEKENHCSV